VWLWKSATQLKLEEITANLVLILRNQGVLDTKADTHYKHLQQQVSQLQQQQLQLRELLYDLLLKGKPGPVQIVITGESDMDQIQFKVVLPPVSAPDVTEREVSVKVGDAEAGVSKLDKGALEITGLNGNEGAEVKVELVDIDNAGNRSPASTASITLVDTVPPPQPGQIGLMVTGETHPAPAPNPQEPGAQGPDDTDPGAQSSDAPAPGDNDPRMSGQAGPETPQA